MKQLFTLLFAFILTGCTITKRHFNSGFHIEWKKSTEAIKKEAFHTEEIDLRTELSEVRSNASDNKESAPKSLISKDTVKNKKINSPADHLLKTQEHRDVAEMDWKPSVKETKPDKQLLDDGITTTNQERKVEKLTWFALGGIALGVFLALTSFLVATPEIIWGVLTGLAILVIIFSFISVIRIRRNPEIYKAKGLSWTLFGLSIAPIGGALVMLVYLILLLTNNADL